MKVPYTAAEPLGARKLRESGVKINFTLEFSARQNVLVAAIIKPNYQNVFLGENPALASVTTDLATDQAPVKEPFWLAKVGNGIDQSNPKTYPADLRPAYRNYPAPGRPGRRGCVYTTAHNVAADGKAKLSGNFRPRLSEGLSGRAQRKSRRLFPRKTVGKLPTKNWDGQKP